MKLIAETLEEFILEDYDRSRAMNQRYFNQYQQNLQIKKIKGELPDFDPNQFLTFMYDRHKNPKVEDIKDTIKLYVEDNSKGKRQFAYEMSTSALANVAKDIIEWLKNTGVIRK